VALTPSRNPSSFKDPREPGEAANQRLSSYFEGKAENKPAFSYSTGGGEAPASGGGAPAPSGPKAPASTGGSGFVNFGQYFGANASAVQAQAEKVAAGAKDFGALNVMQGPGGMGTGTQPPSAFDVMLGQGATSREAAKEGQQRFKQLSARFAEGVDTTMGGKAISQAQKATKDAAYAQWSADLPTQLRYNNTPEQLRAMFEDEWKAGTYKEKTPGMVSTPGSSL